MCARSCTSAPRPRPGWRLHRLCTAHSLLPPSRRQLVRYLPAVLLPLVDEKSQSLGPCPSALSCKLPRLCLIASLSPCASPARFLRLPSAGPRPSSESAYCPVPRSLRLRPVRRAVRLCLRAHPRRRSAFSGRRRRRKLAGPQRRRDHACAVQNACAVPCAVPLRCRGFGTFRECASACVCIAQNGLPLCAAPNKCPPGKMSSSDIFPVGGVCDNRDTNAADDGLQQVDAAVLSHVVTQLTPPRLPSRSLPLSCSTTAPRPARALYGARLRPRRIARRSHHHAVRSTRQALRSCALSAHPMRRTRAVRTAVSVQEGLLVGGERRRRSCHAAGCAAAAADSERCAPPPPRSEDEAVTWLFPEKEDDEGRVDASLQSAQLDYGVVTPSPRPNVVVASPLPPVLRPLLRCQRTRTTTLAR